MPITRWMSALALLALAAPAGQAGDWDSLGRVSKKQTVTVHMRDGRRLKGKMQQVGPETLTLAPQEVPLPSGKEGAAEGGNAIQLKRGDVARVTRKTRLLPMLIGAAAVSVPLGIAIGSSKEKGVPGVTALGVVMCAGVGAGVGAAIGHTSTIYKAEPGK
jgi:hypothetical protein